MNSAYSDRTVCGPPASFLRTCHGFGVAMSADADDVRGSERLRFDQRVAAFERAGVHRIPCRGARDRRSASHLAPIISTSLNRRQSSLAPERSRRSDSIIKEPVSDLLMMKFSEEVLRVEISNALASSGFTG